MAVLHRFTVYHKENKVFSIFEKKTQCVGRGLQRLEYNVPGEIYYQKLFTSIIDICVFLLTWHFISSLPLSRLNHNN